jgi:murein DD-endopeptidase MepM/ murein hydrolase activator NlpD
MAKARLLPILLLLFAGFAANAQVRYAIIPENPRPGEPVTVGVSAENGAAPVSAALVSGGQRLTRAAFFPMPGEGEGASLMAAVLAVPATAKPGAALIQVESAAGLVSAIPLLIAERDFVSEVIELNETLTGIRTDPDPRKTEEAEALWAILNRTGGDIYCSGNFSPPVASTRRTSFFGDRRVFKYSNGKSDTSIHAGVDYGVPKGTEVNACGPGKVVLARFRIVTGNSVIIEHLPGVYSLYYHLDSITAREGGIVDAGTPLGRSGATGLATGPHLHWEIRVSGENTDPDAFIARPILDKDAIMAKIGQ